MSINMIMVNSGFHEPTILKISKDQVVQHRLRLLNAADQLFRERGYERVNLAEIAKAAGLTHGAFYTHFASKEVLFAEVCQRSLERAAAEMLTNSGQPDPLKAFVDQYLDLRHRTARRSGCPMAALADDASRAQPSVQEAFARGLESMISAIAELDPSGPEDDRRRRALARLAKLAGALLLVRAIPDGKLAEEIFVSVQGDDEQMATGKCQSANS